MTAGLVILIFSFTKLVTGNQEGFIVGGDFVDNIRTFPHVAFLELTSDGGVYICGSSVLTQYILITAAHCLEDVDEITAYVGNVKRDHGTPYKVRSHQIHEKYNSATVVYDVGLCKLRKALKLAHNVKRVLLMKHPPKAKIAYVAGWGAVEVESYQQHAGWNSETMEHDMCLCKLSRALTLGKVVKRVLLMRHPPKAKSAVVAGWGAVEEEDYTDSVMLKHTKQKLWTHHECMKVLHHTPKGTICGGKFESLKDYASKGDSGSGLLIDKKIIVGLVSYKDVSVSPSLVVYTDTAYFYDWIKRITRRLQCS